MREIMFRGKSRSLRAGDWIYGYYNGPVGIDGSHEICDINDACGLMIEVDPETVGQYTGRKDKNGKRIFEGDIVRARLEEGVHAGFEWPVMRIEYRDAAFTLVDKLGRAFCTMAALAPNIGLEVLGNVHDDPELIGGVSDENA